jgi:flagellin-like hook-associated protein FlgL
VITGNFTWHQAKADAEARGGHLVTITSEEEWQKVLLKAPASDSSNLWIGATDENNEGQWEWVTGEPWSYTNWGIWDVAAPNNYQGSEHYGHIFSNTSYWNDYPNDTSVYGLNGFGYILEKPVVHLLDLPWSDLHASIQQVANARAQNGAEQMRLQMEADLNATNTTNLESALSRIRDVDIAQTTSDLAKTRVLIDAGTAMSAQANSYQQSILKLLDSTRN